MKIKLPPFSEYTCVNTNIRLSKNPKNVAISMTSLFSSVKDRVGVQYIGHETAICRNPPTHDFTGDRRNLTDSEQANSLHT
jgi:hypothetical protein